MSETHPLLSIGIPTYNRANLLEESLNSVINQSLKDLKIIISNNGSTDDTKEIINKFRIKFPNKIDQIWEYKETVPANTNFKKVLSLANTKYFTWLQDDDLVHYDLYRRGVQALESNSKATMYLCYAHYASNPYSSNNPYLWGPPFRLNWLNNEVLTFPGLAVIPLSLFSTLGFSPVAVFRKSALEEAIQYMDRPYWLLTERTILSKVAIQGDVIIDPFIGGLFRAHEGQMSKAALDKDLFNRHFMMMLEDLTEMKIAFSNSGWELGFSELLYKIDVNLVKSWYFNNTKYSTYNEFIIQVFEIIKLHLERNSIFMKPLKKSIFVRVIGRFNRAFNVLLGK